MGKEIKKDKGMSSGLPRTTSHRKVREMAVPDMSRNIQEARSTERMNWGKGKSIG